MKTGGGSYAIERWRGFGFGRTALALVSGCGLLAPATGLAAGSLVTNPDLVDNRFEDYYLQPCIDGAATLFGRGWSIEEINAYNASICSVVYSSGTFNSSDTYQSTQNIGSIGAQTKSTNVVAKKEVDSIQARLDELAVEEDVRKGGWGILLSAQKSETERVSTNNEIGYDADLDGIMAGLDYRFNDSLVAGIAVGLTNDKADYAGGSGTLKTESRTLMGYTTYLIGNHGHVDGYLGFAQLDYTTDRDISIDGEAADAFGFTGNISADFQGDQILAGVSAGYDWYPGNLSYGYFGAIDYSKTNLDGYSEEGNTGLELKYPDQDPKSLTITLGATASYSIDMGWGAMIPNVTVSAVHQQESDARSFNARLLIMPDVDTTSLKLETDDPDRNYLISSLGVTFQLNKGGQVFVTYEVLSQHDFLEVSSISAGFLAEF
ncbi:MAG TPA: autotransporter outer membrane beta-barrel domain-containing protein [Gammaproteobacteria bacterium]|nr:autotransporter outer membrane beta-barrel domain-containing protein [Gammaproteobacteria bacterium]